MDVQLYAVQFFYSRGGNWVTVDCAADPGEAFDLMWARANMSKGTPYRVSPGNAEVVIAPY